MEAPTKKDAPLQRSLKSQKPSKPKALKAKSSGLVTNPSRAVLDVGSAVKVLVVALSRMNSTMPSLKKLTPEMPLTREELDKVYALPYMRTYHPVYEKDGGVPGILEVQFSITHKT